MKDPNRFTLELEDATFEVRGDGILVIAEHGSAVVPWDQAAELHAWLGEQLQRRNDGPEE